MTADDHRDTLGMPDVLDEYPVPGPRSMDGVLGFSVTELGEAEVLGEAPVTDSVRQRFGLVHGGTYAALAEMLATEGTVFGVWEQGNAAMGLSNATNFMRPITDGTIHGRARRIDAGPDHLDLGRRLHRRPGPSLRRVARDRRGQAAARTASRWSRAASGPAPTGDAGDPEQPGCLRGDHHVAGERHASGEVRLDRIGVAGRQRAGTPLRRR